jgi:cytochrome c biogenesis protein CcdA
LMKLQTTVAPATSSTDPFCSPEEDAKAAAQSHAVGHVHGPGFGSWTTYTNWLGASFLIFFALKSLGVLKPGGHCFVWLAQLGRRIRFALAAVIGLFSEKHAAVIRAPAASMRQSSNITAANSFCAGLGLSVRCLTCMGGAILYPLLIFVGTSTWYWGAMILGTYSLALALPMAAIAVAVGNYAWQWVHRPWLTRGLQWTSGVVMILVAVLIMFDRTRAINSVVFTILSAIGGTPEAALAKL